MKCVKILRIKSKTPPHSEPCTVRSLLCDKQNIERKKKEREAKDVKHKNWTYSNNKEINRWNSNVEKKTKQKPTISNNTKWKPNWNLKIHKGKVDDRFINGTLNSASHSLLTSSSCRQASSATCPTSRSWWPTGRERMTTATSCSSPRFTSTPLKEWEFLSVCIHITRRSPCNVPCQAFM